MTIYYYNPNQYSNLTATLLIINKQQIRIYWGKSHSSDSESAGFKGS